MVKVLITTPDYPPKLGGLSTYTKDLEFVLGRIFKEVDVLVWHKYDDLKINNSHEYKYIFNVNYLGGYIGKWDLNKNINIIHGSEILFYSNNFFKKIYKKLFKFKIINYFEKSYRNIFISSFTMKKLASFGFEINYARDIVFHNCTDLKFGDFDLKNIEESESIKFCCIARDVPHKNMQGVVSLLEKIAKNYNDYKIELNVTSQNYKSDLITINPLQNLTDEQREEIYKKSHFNILLSRDHSHKGYFEGFGLTCLESAKYGTPSIVSDTGGLPENVHHELNGLVYEEGKDSEFLDAFKKFIIDFTLKQKQTYEHVIESHGLDTYEEYIKGILRE